MVPIFLTTATTAVGVIPMIIAQSSFWMPVGVTIFAGGILASCVNFIPLYVIGAAERSGTTSQMKHIGPVTGEIIGSLFAVLLLGAALIALILFSLVKAAVVAAIALL